MKIIKGFENEDIVVSDFGEWVGKDYIDYKAEYKSNQKLIKILLDENQKLKDNWIKLRQKMIDSFNKTQDVQFLEVLQDMQELEGSDSNE